MAASSDSCSSTGIATDVNNLVGAQHAWRTTAFTNVKTCLCLSLLNLRLHRLGHRPVNIKTQAAKFFLDLRDTRPTVLGQALCHQCLDFTFTGTAQAVNQIKPAITTFKSTLRE